MKRKKIGFIENCKHKKTRLAKLGARTIKQCSECYYILAYLKINPKNLPKWNHGVYNGEEIRLTRIDVPDHVKQPKSNGKSKNKNDWWVKYREYLLSSHWKSLRVQTLKRDNYICQECKSRKATDVHHLSYKEYNLTGKSKLYELQSLCNICHKNLHT